MKTHSLLVHTLSNYVNIAKARIYDLTASENKKKTVNYTNSLKLTQNPQ